MTQRTFKAPFLLAGIAASLLLGGCASNGPVRDPAYAPAMPPVEVAPQVADGSIYRAGYGMALFEDNKARNVGDILTIELSEKTDASKTAGTTTNRDSSIALANATLFGTTPTLNGKNVLDNSVEFSNTFAGDGSSAQSNTLSGDITVTVAQVLPNGNLVVRGEKLVTINQGDEFIRIAGIVRPQDVSADNTVRSTKVANAQITYAGTGAVADANRMGWLARFFQSVIWPF